MSSTTINIDEQDTHFVGYYIASTGPVRIISTGSWFTSGNYAGYCALPSGQTCGVATQCSDKTLEYNDGNIVACEASYSCFTATIYQSSPDVLPSASNIWCRSAWSANTFYRQLSQPTTSSSTSPSSSSRSLIITSFSTTRVQSTPTNPTTPSPTPSPNKSWIAGAVIGPIAAIALVILTSWLVLLCRKKLGLATPHLLWHKEQQLAEMEGQRLAEMEVEQRPHPTSELPNASVG